MTRSLISVLALCLIAVPSESQTGSAPAGQTPQPGVVGAAPTRIPGNPPTASTGGTRPGTRRGNRNRPAAVPASTAPVGNSTVEILGSTDKAGKPTLDHPILNIAPVGNALGIRSGTPIRVQLQATADSGHVRNGDVVQATLAAPLAGLPQGTPVQLTVVQSSRAGALNSAGELSLQVTRIGSHDVLSVIVTALGNEGKKELADAAPAPGTEAEFAAGQDLVFPAA